MSYFPTITITASALPTGASTAAKQDTGNTSLSSIDGKITAVNTGAVVVSSSALPSGAATSANQTTELTRLGDVTEAAPATDTASSGLNGRLQRIAQRLSSLITALGSPFQAGGSIGNTAFIANAGTNLNTSTLALESGGNLATIAGKDFATQTTLALIKAKTDNIDVALSTRTKPADTQTISGAVTANAGTNLNTSALALDSTVAKDASITTTNTEIGIVTEAAPATDTASSGLNGRLQRIAQRLTSLITALGSPFQAGGSIGNTTFASTQSGTWTVQPGNTANSTAWKVDGSAVTQPVSGTFFQTTQPISATELPQATLPAAPLNNQKTVATAGTRVQLQTNTLSVGVIIQAMSTNTGLIYVGDSTVSSSNGFELQPGQATSVGITNTNAIWIDSSANGDKVCYIGS